MPAPVPQTKPLPHLSPSPMGLVVSMGAIVSVQDGAPTHKGCSAGRESFMMWGITADEPVRHQSGLK